ncbi:MAG: GLUG motif-containing protein, partial [Clostridia bacterium]|nr:GLUG motif-containing protein [Clostridia bacterium]
IDIYLVVFNTEISYDLKDVTACNKVTVTINRHVIHTSNTTFYISDIDGLLSFNAIVNGMDTTQTGHIDCGLKNTARFANTMQDSTIVLLNDIDYNPNFTFDMAMEDINNHEITGLNYAAGDPIILDAQGNATEETPISWIPIGSPGGWYYDEEFDDWFYSECYVFNGTFDGNNHTISGLYYNENWAAGLFGYMNGAEIKNLGIENSYFGSLYGCAGGIVAWAENAVITNCYNTGNVKSGFIAGGIVGLYGYLGGGYVDSPKPLTTNSNPQLCAPEVEPNESIIMNCYNTGKILVYNTEGDVAEATGSSAGGIAGIARNQQIIDSYNNGNISGISVYEDDWYRTQVEVGGITGYSYGMAIINCYNTGNVNASVFNRNGADAGGINGTISYCFTVNCYNTGNINVNIVSSESYANLGGINGYCSRSDVINCFNTANVEISGVVLIEFSCIGGVNAYVYDGLVDDCYNTGNVSGMVNYIGGLMGDLNSATVTNCHNSGLVNEVEATLDNLVGAGTVGEGCDNEGISHFGIINKLNEFITDLLAYETPPYTLSEWQFAEPYLKIFGIQDLPRNLKDATECTATTITIDGVTYETNGTTFYIDDIDGLLTLSAIVGGIDTTGIYDNCGLANSKDNANSMAGAIIMLIEDIDYNPGVTFNMNSDGTANISGEGTPVLWKPIGLNYEETDYAFSGTFNGNSFTISGLYVENVTYAGLFGLANSAEINDSNVENSYMSGNFSGGIVAVATDTTLTNCDNSGNISSFEDYGAGGIVCDASESTIINCDNSGNINVVSGYSGGIVAWASENTIIQKCNNSGDINGFDLSGIGGIVGEADNTTISNCQNAGNININNNGDLASYAGGIAGFITLSSTITNCNNEGSIEGINLLAGGVVAFADLGSSVTDCYNVGNITITAVTDSIDAFAGGIVGVFTSNLTSYITNCCNTANVKIINQSYNASYVGGIVALVSGEAMCNISDCYNNGEITSTTTADNVDYAGGIAGYANNITIINCYNSNIVNASGDSFPGGIVGCAEASTIINCYNTGNVTGNYGAGGIVGDLKSDVINCYNSGTITGTDVDYVGAIVGNLFNGTVTYCHHLNDKTPAKLIGYGTAGEGCSIDTQENIINKLNEYVYTGELDLSEWQLLESHLKVFGVKLDLSLATSCTETTVTIDGIEYETNGGIFYITNINSLLTLSAIVGVTDTTSTNHGSDVGFNNASGVANSMAGATIILYKDIDYNPGFTLGMNEDGTADISGEGTPASWMPIGNSSHSFQGTFEGNNFTISGLYVSSGNYIGLFGYATNATIKNLTIENSYLGGTSYIGGIAGYTNEVTITNCHNYANIFGQNYLGGITGYTYTVTILNCHNGGNISSNTNNYTGYIGGLVGYAHYDTYITNCYNTGNINGSIRENVGGLVGFINYYGYIINCYNAGEVTGGNSVGGIVGRVEGANIINCYNTETVNGSFNSGGIVGYAYASVNITNCYNTGNVNGNVPPSYSSACNAGGIVGYADRWSVTVTNCYNTGNVKTPSYAGGLVGRMNNNITITYCHNSGLINDAAATISNFVGNGSVGEGCDNEAINHSGIIIKLNEYVTNYSGELDLLSWREQPEPYLVFV